MMRINHSSMEGGDDAMDAMMGAPDADMEAAAPKVEMTDEEAMAAAIKRNKEIMTRTKEIMAKRNNAMDDAGEPNVTAERMNGPAASAFKSKLCIEFWCKGFFYGLLILIADIYR